MPREASWRRRTPRVPVGLPAMLRGRAARPVTLVDLSLSGCLLRTEQPLARGSIHDLELTLPHGALRAKARATESSRDGAATGGAERFLVGLEFLGLPASDEAELRAFLEGAARRCELVR